MDDRHGTREPVEARPWIQVLERCGREGGLASDDGAGVAHALPSRRGLADDAGHDRLPDALLDELRSALLAVPADLADQHDRFGFRVLLEEAKHVVSASERLAMIRRA